MVDAKTRKFIAYLPRFLEDLQHDPNNPRARTINAMFKHVAPDAKDIADLGTEEARAQRQSGQQPNAETVAKDQRRKEERAIRLNSASNDISTRFSDWWSQRRHKIRYHADGDYFRIWVADDRRPDVEIELEARSKGFQWSCHCPECGSVLVAADDVAALVLDEDWLRHKLRLALEIESRDGVDDHPSATDNGWQ